MDYCRRCGRMKAADGYPFCGGSYCQMESGPDDDDRPTAETVNFEDTSPETP